MGKIGIATSPDVAPTGYALARNDVWVHGVKHEVIKDEVDLDNRILAAETAGAWAVAESSIVIDKVVEEDTAA